jgi:acyl carrier protein
LTETRLIIRRYVQDNFLYLRPEIDPTDEESLLDLGVIDSTGVVELVMEVETRFGIEVRDAEITEEHFGSIAALAAFVDRKRHTE